MNSILENGRWSLQFTSLASALIKAGSLGRMCGDKAKISPRFLAAATLYVNEEYSISFAMNEDSSKSSMDEGGGMS